MKRKFLIATTCLLVLSFIAVKTSLAGEIPLGWDYSTVTPFIVLDPDGWNIHINNLAGFNIYITDSSGKVDIYNVGMGEEDFALCVNVPKCTYRKAVIHRVKPGVYKIFLKAHDESGNESKPSNQLEISVIDPK